MSFQISDQEFGRFQRFIYETAGISLSPAKKALVCGRLSKRLQARQVQSFGDYFKLLGTEAGREEMQTAIDLLTTNETYFFREPRHFEVLREASLAAGRSQPFRVWSAASSSGEEAYSMAMVLDDAVGAVGWEVLGTDISTRMLQRARSAHYPMSRARQIPAAYLKRYCLKGIGAHDGTLLIERSLRSRVAFAHANLNAPLPQLGDFDVIFLRNVMIYFNAETKRQVVARVISLLKPGGCLCIGHSESLNDITEAVRPVAPSIYRKP